MQKIYLIIGVIIVTLVVVFLVFFNNSPATPTSQPQTNPPNQASFSTQPTIPPTEAELTAQQRATIKNQFDSFASSQQIAQSVSYFDAKDSSGKVVNIDQSFKALDIQVSASLAKILNKKDYRYFSCQENGKKAYGIYLHAGLLSKTEDLSKIMKSWEFSMLKDLHNVLFPGIVFSDETLSQAVVFQNGKSRFATIALPDQTQGSINYKVINDIIYIASSLSCLETGADDSYDP